MGLPVGGPAGLDEDFFSSFMDMLKIGFENGEEEEGDVVGTKTRPRRRQCTYGDWRLAVFGLEAKSAIDADNLASWRLYSLCFNWVIGSGFHIDLNTYVELL